MNTTSPAMLNGVTAYQCPGCLHGPSATEGCPKFASTSSGCTEHKAGTMGLREGVFALGLPPGFNRFGPSEHRSIEVFESFELMLEIYPNLTTIFSIPVWKYLDKEGNTISRWFSPRTNYGWSCVILGDCRAKMPSAREITDEDIAKMD